MARLFISQGRLDNWTFEERVSVKDDVMTLSKDGRAFQLRPAVRFLKLAGADIDPHKLVGRVKTEEQLAQMNAEHYLESVLVGDVAYDVQTGWVGLPMPSG
jgi:hypothetical protein